MTTGNEDRRGDWEKGVDENLASLNAGRRIQDRDLSLLRKDVDKHDVVLRGDPQSDTDGMAARLHNQETEINLLKAVVLKDRAGGHGLVDRIEALEKRERDSDRRLKVWIAVIGLLSAVLVAAASNVDRIERFLNKKDNDPVSKAIERAKRPPRKHIRVRLDLREPRPPTEQQEPSKTDL